jgi:hypothetical protein
MMSRHEPFAVVKPVADYLRLPGHEANGMLLSSMALDALARSKMTGKPCEVVVTGQQIREDGAVFLDLSANPEFIEATTDWRRDGRRFRLICPECEMRDGKHLKSCGRGR